MPFGQKTHLEVSTIDTARSMAVSHVFELTHDLQSVVQSGDHVVQAVSDQGDLLHVVGVGVQLSDGEVTEGNESLLQGRVNDEQPGWADT